MLKSEYYSLNSQQNEIYIVFVVQIDKVLFDYNCCFIVVLYSEAPNLNVLPFYATPRDFLKNIFYEF